jgi:DNA ligase 1
MPNIQDGQKVYVQGSAKAPYELKNVGGVYSCSCPAWRNAGGPIDTRVCKHLRAHCGDELFSASQRHVPRKSADPKTSAAPVLLAHSWDNSQDLTGWWMSEKLDGVRAYWNGAHFVSRLGNQFFAPDWFTNELPSEPLDGELWVGRKQFEATVSIVRRQDAGDQWKKLQFLIFDAPAQQGPFEARLDFLRNWAGKKRTFAHLVEHLRCEGTLHLKRELASVESLGGEGLMLREPKSHYEVGRSHTLLKVKSFFDAEARVVAYEPGKGKHKGRLGALVLQMPSGARFNVGTGLSDAERESPPCVGELVTYRYQELSKAGVPRFPSYVGPAIDKR